MPTRQTETEILAAQIERPLLGLTWEPSGGNVEFPITGLPAWQSNGGPTRGHSSRSLPFSFESRLPEQSGRLIRIHVLGVFALYAEKEAEAPGTVGATIQLLVGEREIAARFDLVNGRHYFDGIRPETICRVIGDGTSIETVGHVQIQNEPHRVDVLTLDIPRGTRPKRIQFKDLGSPASFVVFDVFLEYEKNPASFGTGSSSGSLALSELGAAIRVGDRLKFARALEQLDLALDESDDLDDARATALTFLAVVSAALIESGGVKSVQRLQLDAAREFELLKTRNQIKSGIHERVMSVTEGLFAPSESPSDRLVDRALAIVERHYAKDLTDAMVAAQLGLSTSHFRFLFRQATGNPFHKYVVALRLEKAKQMLIEQELPVSQVATAVGFTGLSHFSRAFAQRFSASPSHVRRAAS